LTPIVVALRRILPSPVNVVPASRLKVFPPNCSVRPAATSKLPVLVSVPELKFNDPACTRTAPVLVMGIWNVVVPAPADFLKVPELLNMGKVPTPQTIDASL